jgi:hypothetical protein
MRLLKHQTVPVTYSITDISMTELAYIQLTLIGWDQPELKVDEFWVPSQPGCPICGQ